MLPRTTRTTRRGRVAVLATGALVVVPMVGVSASADAAGTVTPFFDCITQNAANGLDTAYFGYNSSFTSSENIAIGDGNQIIPGDQFQGQPTTFDPGNYPRVFEVTFDPLIAPSITWILNGVGAVATNQSPVCVGAVTAPAELISGTSATITGVVVPDGTDTSYHFEWGATPSLGDSTPLVDQGADTNPTLVQAQLTGLTPGTQYYYRLDENTGFAVGSGQVLSFTAVAPVAAPPVAVTTKDLPAGMVGKPYSAKLAATGGTGSYTWSITSGALPAGLSLNPATGVISGTPGRRAADRTAQITVEVTDSASATATHRFTIWILPSFHFGW